MRTNVINSLSTYSSLPLNVASVKGPQPCSSSIKFMSPPRECIQSTSIVPAALMPSYIAFASTFPDGQSASSYEDAIERKKSRQCEHSHILSVFYVIVALRSVNQSFRISTTINVPRRIRAEGREDGQTTSNTHRAIGYR